jgi:hypothetical protein
MQSYTHVYNLRSTWLFFAGAAQKITLAPFFFNNQKEHKSEGHSLISYFKISYLMKKLKIFPLPF